MSSDHPLSKQTCLVKEPAEWEWNSFRHDSLREVGMVEIESEWTVHDREMLTFGGCARLFPGPEPALSLSRGQRQSTARTWDTRLRKGSALSGVEGNGESLVRVVSAKIKD